MVAWCADGFVMRVVGRIRCWNGLVLFVCWSVCVRVERSLDRKRTDGAAAAIVSALAEVRVERGRRTAVAVGSDHDKTVHIDGVRA